MLPFPVVVFSPCSKLTVRLARPQYTFSVFHADIPRLRKQWLFYDLMSADAVTGQIDNCLFSLHRPQSIGRTSEEDLRGARWARMVRRALSSYIRSHANTR